MGGKYQQQGRSYEGSEPTGSVRGGAARTRATTHDDTAERGEYYGNVQAKRNVGKIK
jgi:hypothetical protein